MTHALTTHETTTTESPMNTAIAITKTQTKRRPLEVRIDRLATRARESVCPSTIAGAVRAMTAELDPEAIPALIGLLRHQHDAKESVTRALLRYGDSAEDSLRAAAKDEPLAGLVLEAMSLRNRFLQVGCF